VLYIATASEERDHHVSSGTSSLARSHSSVRLTTNPRSLEVVNGQSSPLSSIGRSEDQLELSSSGSDEVCRLVLISEGVSTDHDGLGPSWDGLGDGGDDDLMEERIS